MGASHEPPEEEAEPDEDLPLFPSEERSLPAPRRFTAWFNNTLALDPLFPLLPPLEPLPLFLILIIAWYKRKKLGGESERGVSCVFSYGGYNEIISYIIYS